MIEWQKTTRAALIAALAMAPIGAIAQAPEAQAPDAQAAPAPETGKLDRALNERIGADDASRASQQRIEQLDDETQRMLNEYRKAVSDTESYQRYTEQLTAQIDSQTQEMASIDQQLREVETTSREIAPLMQKMLATLGEFVSLDVPFLVEERTKRVAALEAMMPRADVTFSEKYRRILEAYQVEMEYGRTIEAYEAKLGSEADARTVQFLRVGRVALLYQTLDGKETGYWDSRQRKWVVDDDYAHAFKEGIAVAKKLTAPELLIVPVPAPKESAS